MARKYLVTNNRRAKIFQETGTRKSIVGGGIVQETTPTSGAAVELLTTLSDTDRGIGQARAARLGGELQ